MDETDTVELPIFELPLAILPTERVPLHIFEERYKRMIAHCREEEIPFGIVLRTDEGARSRGCAAELTETLEEFDDGRLNIVVTGAWRFDVLDRWDGPEFPLATVEPLADEPDPSADPSAAREAFGKLLEALDSDAELEPDDSTAYALAARVEIAVEDKQLLLETDSEPTRLELLAQTLRALVEQVARTRRLAERARRNGHAPIEGLSGS